MDPEKIELFKPSNETPVVDREEDKQEILKTLELQLANKQQELAVLDPELRLVPTEELTAKKNQLDREIEEIRSQKSALTQEVTLPQAEIKTAPEQTIKPEAPVDDFKISIETDPDFLKKKFAEQGINSGQVKAEQINSDLGQVIKTEKSQTAETFLEKTDKELDDIGREYNTKITDARIKSQTEQSAEQPTDQFETTDQLKEEMERNEEQVKEMSVEATPDKIEPIKEATIEKKSVLTEIFSNPEAEKRILEIQTKLGQTKEEIQALKEEVADREQKVKTLEKEMDKLEQESMTTFFRNAPRLRRANERGATAVTRGMAISELHAALEKYDKTQDRGFVEKIMKKLSAKMRKLFKQAYPELFPKKAKPEKAEKPAKIKKEAKSKSWGKGLVGKEGVSVA